MNYYRHGLDILGADPVYYGPPSPADLAQLDRKLTPAEQKAVDEYQSKQAEGYETSALASGAPAAKTVTVGPKGAVIQSQAKPKDEKSPWGWVLLAGGVALTGYGLYKMVGR